MHELFEKLLAIISNPRFLSGESAGAETPFYICPYAVADAEPMKEMVAQLAKKLAERNVSVLKIDVFGLMVETLKTNNDYDWTIEHEPELSFPALSEHLNGVLDTERVIAPAIGKLVATDPNTRNRVVFLTNIGACYPMLHASTLLETLANILSNTTLVLFFPGEYQQVIGVGASLSLFARLHSDRHYRAFNIREMTI